MRTSSLLLALPALTLADDQAPLGGFFNKLKDAVKAASTYIPNGMPSGFPDPLDAGAAKVAAKVVHKLHFNDWRDVVKPSPAAAQSSEPEHWMVYLTGGNKTCLGFCDDADAAWNKSAAALAAIPKGPQLAVLDCEEEAVMCNGWAAGPPSIYYFLLPQPLADQSTPATTVYYHPLNRTATSTQEITELYTKKDYANKEPYEGLFHPFDSPLVKYGLVVPVAYFLWGMAKMPSWVPMVVISFFSRSIMNRRMPQGQRGAAPAPAAAR